MYISRVARRAFDAPPAVTARPGHRAHFQEYVSDLVAPYGFPLRDGGSGEDGDGHSYGEMAAPLVEELVPDDEPVDLLVLAFAVPDVRPGRATATYLSHLCPGNPLGFAVCDQQGATGFTALRVVDAYARTERVRRALLLVVEQAGLPHDPGAVDLPTGHTAVGLRCDRSGPARLDSVRQYPDVEPDRASALLSDELATVGPQGGAPILVADPTLAGTSAALRTAAPGRPHTGVWWELAGALEDGTGPGRLVLAGYDRQLAYLCLATIDVAT